MTSLASPCLLGRAHPSGLTPADAAEPAGAWLSVHTPEALPGPCGNQWACGAARCGAVRGRCGGRREAPRGTLADPAPSNVSRRSTLCMLWVVCTHMDHTVTCRSGVKTLLPPLAAWCPSWPPVPLQGAPGGSRQLGTPRARGPVNGTPSTSSGPHGSSAAS